MFYAYRFNWLIHLNVLIEPNNLTVIVNILDSIKWLEST